MQFLLIRQHPSMMRTVLPTVRGERGRAWSGGEYTWSGACVVPPPPVDGQICVKTLPSRNFVCGRLWFKTAIFSCNETHRCHRILSDVFLSAQWPGQFEEDLFETIFSIRGRFDEGEAWNHASHKKKQGGREIVYRLHRNVSWVSRSNSH